MLRILYNFWNETNFKKHFQDNEIKYDSVKDLGLANYFIC